MEEIIHSLKYQTSWKFYGFFNRKKTKYPSDSINDFQSENAMLRHTCAVQFGSVTRKLTRDCFVFSSYIDKNSERDLVDRVHFVSKLVGVEIKSPQVVPCYGSALLHVSWFKEMNSSITVQQNELAVGFSQTFSQACRHWLSFTMLFLIAFQREVVRFTYSFDEVKRNLCISQSESSVRPRQNEVGWKHF